MDIERQKITQYGSCNFCRRGVLGKNGGAMEYPYTEVTQISGTMNCAVAVRFCDECLQEVSDRLFTNGGG